MTVEAPAHVISHYAETTGELDRVRSIETAHKLRALAWVALRDGAPKAELRAANARSAARIVLRHAKHAAVLSSLTPGQDPASR